MQAFGLQLHIVYNLDHEDIEPLFQVCQELRSMVSRDTCFLIVESCASQHLAQLIVRLPRFLQMHTAMLLHFTYITPHRQPYDSLPRVTVKKRAMIRAQPASSSSSR